jgi:hypothetical protein
MKKKIVYRYDANTKILMGPMECQPSPLEEGVYIVPANSSELKPPAKKKNEVLVFAEDRWKRVADYVGVTFWDKKTKEAITITEVGVTPRNTWTDKHPGEDDAWDETSNSWVFSKDIFNSNLDAKIKSLRFLLFTALRDMKQAQEMDMNDVADGLKVQAELLDKEILTLIKQKK